MIPLVFVGYPIVHAAAGWERKVHDQPPLPGVLLGHCTPGVDDEISEGWPGEGPCGVAQSALLGEVLVYHLWSTDGRGEVGG